MNILGKSRLSQNQWCTYIIFLSVFFYFFVAERYFRVSRRNLRAPLRANQFQASKTPQGNPKSFQADFPDYQHVEWLSADIVIKATDRKWHSFPLITITFFTSVLWQTSGRCICYSRSFLTKCRAFNIRWTVLLVYKTHLHFTGICAYFNDIVWLYIISTFFLPIFSLCRLSCPKSLFPIRSDVEGRGEGFILFHSHEWPGQNFS